MPWQLEKDLCPKAILFLAKPFRLFLLTDVFADDFASVFKVICVLVRQMLTKLHQPENSTTCKWKRNQQRQERWLYAVSSCLV